MNARIVNATHPPMLPNIAMASTKQIRFEKVSQDKAFKNDRFGVLESGFIS
jgi:hypothetical protein